MAVMHHEVKRIENKMVRVGFVSDIKHAMMLVVSEKVKWGLKQQKKPRRRLYEGLGVIYCSYA